MKPSATNDGSIDAMFEESVHSVVDSPILRGVCQVGLAEK